VQEEILVEVLDVSGLEKEGSMRVCIAFLEENEIMFTNDNQYAYNNTKDYPISTTISKPLKPSELQPSKKLIIKESFTFSMDLKSQYLNSLIPQYLLI
jgi:hypothetical protein